MLLASRFVVGLMATGQLTAATSVVGERFSRQQRGKVIGLQTAFATLGGIAVVLAAGALAERFGWHAPFALYATAFPVLLLGVAVIAPSIPRKEIERTPLRVFLPLLPMYLVVTVTMMASFLSTIQVPLLLSEDGISNPRPLSIALGLSTLALAVGAFSYGSIRARLGAGWTVSTGLALQGLGIVGLSVGHGLVQLSLAAIVLSLGGGILNPAFSHRVLDEAPESVRGRAVGLLFTAQFAGPFLNTALIVPAIAAFGRRETLVIIGLMLLIATLAATIRRGFGVPGRAAGH
jgi:MFS family permease